VQLVQLVHHRRSQVGAAVAEQLGPDSQAAFGVAVSEAPGAERDHDWQHLSIPLGCATVLSARGA
jgi:hypothetical protein